MRYLAILGATALLTACSESAAPVEEAPAEAEAVETAAAAPEVDDEEAAKRRESMIATWAAQFQLSEDQAACLVDTVQWEALIAAEQTPETVEAITVCEADPAAFAGYGQ